MFFYGIYVLAAVLPAVILMRYIYLKDKVEQEPTGLLIRLIIAGVISALGAVILEEIGTNVLGMVVSPYDPLYVVFLAFAVVAFAEELMKVICMKKVTWRNPNFNYRFDGTVYAVFTSLGFAAFENIGYVFGYGLGVAPARAILAIPGHMSFAVFMGYFYGRAKLCYDCGDDAGAFRNQVLALVVAIFLHGFYDACALSGSEAASLLFIVFIVIVDIAMIRTVKREANTDEPV